MQHMLGKRSADTNISMQVDQALTGKFFIQRTLLPRFESKPEDSFLDDKWRSSSEYCASPAIISERILKSWNLLLGNKKHKTVLSSHKTSSVHWFAFGKCLSWDCLEISQLERHAHHKKVFSFFFYKRSWQKPSPHKRRLNRTRIGRDEDTKTEVDTIRQSIN